MLRLFGNKGGSRLLTAASALLAVSLANAAWRWTRAPRAWRPEEVPVAFWAWRAATPSQEEVEGAARETGARVLFMRAGQFDLSSGSVGRIRGVEGQMPRRVELHLVYNATPALLAGFEGVDERALAEAFAATFIKDSERAARDGAAVAGLQLDLDVPTRLLARYGRVLAATRPMLPAGARLSVTGLETWAASPRLGAVLDAVDFWLPQFYGAEVPATIDRIVPVSSPRAVSRAAARARELGKPFYAGVAAYGYALLYSEKGEVLELRGDIDPARVAADGNFELVERRAFEPRAEGDGAGRDAAALAGEWRYVFRARAETVLEGLTVRAGEQIVLDVPSSESLRASAQGVRAAAGDKLLGICIFRLPTRGDATTLGLRQIAAALADRDAESSARISVEAARPSGPGGNISDQLLLTLENDGAAGSLLGDDALAVTLAVPRGSVRGVARVEGFDSFETLCESVSSASADSRGRAARAGARPCGAARANVLRLKARAWPPGARARVGLSLAGDAPARMSASVAVRREDGRAWERQHFLSAGELEGR